MVIEQNVKSQDESFEKLKHNRDQIFALISEAEFIRTQLCEVFENASTRDVTAVAPSPIPTLPAYDLNSPVASTIYLSERSRARKGKRDSQISRLDQVSPDLEAIIHTVPSSTHRKALIAIDQRGVDGIRCKSGFSALHWAYRENNMAVVKYLIKRGANQALRDEHGRLPHEYGRSGLVGGKGTEGSRLHQMVNLDTLPVSQRRALEAIDQHGWNCVKWGGGWTILHWAYSVGRKDVIEFCKGINAPFDTRDEKNMLPVQYARNL